MEEPKADLPPPIQVSNPPPPPPPSTAQFIPEQPLPPLPPKTKKRPFDTNFQHHSKMRAVLKDLRPHFFEVLRTPDFRNCKAAHEIREKIKLLLELNQLMKAETVGTKKLKSVDGQPLSAENQNRQGPQGQPCSIKTAEQTQKDKVYAKPSENKFPSSNAFEKKQAEDGQISGSYVVGGSAFGWNFITYSGEKPVYYGVTKESFRAAN